MRWAGRSVFRWEGRLRPEPGHIFHRFYDFLASSFIFFRMFLFSSAASLIFVAFLMSP